MNRLYLLPIGLTLLTLTSCSEDLALLNERPGQILSVVPEVFAPGIVSTDAPEFAVSFSPDGRTVFFNRSRADRSSHTILTSSWADGSWSTPDTAFFSGDYRDVDPFVTPDGQRIWFSSDRPRDSGEQRSFNNWYVERRGNGWSEPIDPGYPLNTDSSDVFVSISAGGTVYFSSIRDGRRRVYATRETEDGWSEARPIQMGDVVGAGNPLISPGGTFLIVAITTPESGPDLFLSCRGENEWLQPMRLPESINSDFADFAAGLSSDGDVLYFTSERPGIVSATEDGVRPPGDIYQVAFGNPCQN